MAVTMHAKSDSEVTSIDASSPPRSPRRPLYYVQSPSQHDVEKMSYGSSPFGSPAHHHYHCSPIHHSRESSTSRFSASGLKHHPAAWKRLQRLPHDGANDKDDDDDDSDDAGGGGQVMRFYVVCFVFSFVVLFTVFSLILWAASLPYKPKIFVKGMVFHNFNIQAGMDQTGVPTDMLTLNSTVRIFYRNPATFFGVHVTSTPVELHYYQLKVATGYIKKFYQSRKSQRMIVTEVLGNQVPLYGGIPRLSGAKDRLESVSVPLNLTFLVRSRAYILGRLVKPKFYRNITCEVILEGNRLGKHHNLANSCIYKV
ncbi:NDR1/HIN1-Like protein [Actinidia chinensis var. chinensis]|uniref:NDR1/HIN1-Like protein n=1 Tax=Actinidia chinensis var. chinensis TaxID=1590841 RepID=A0A2R6R6Z1_ACTCC|nr:NDR1/HIN1-Like protein [Actinidia chinensis var. chinensis]